MFPIFKNPSAIYAPFSYARSLYKIEYLVVEACTLNRLKDKVQARLDEHVGWELQYGIVIGPNYVAQILTREVYVG